MGRKPEPFEFAERDRDELHRWVSASNTKRSLAERARVILMSADGVPVQQICAHLGLTEQSVYKWRVRYRNDGVAALKDLPRPGQPRKVTEDLAKKILKLTVERVPAEAKFWSIRLMMKYAGVTQHQVMEVWKAADLKPHRLKNFKISNDPRFAEKVVDVVGLYMDPPDNAVVLSVDEKTQIQALERTQQLLPLAPAKTPGRTHDYKRHGTASLYAAFNIATGEVIGRVTERHRAREFLAFLRQINDAVPRKLDLHVILDNSSTHKTPEVTEWLAKHPRFKLHFTPTSASWLNAVEGWFGQLERRALYRGNYSSVSELRVDLKRYIEVHNTQSAKPFRWTVTAKAIIAKVNQIKKAVHHGN
jgi:transposase